MVLPNPTIFRGPMNTVDSSLAGGTALGNQVIRLFTDYQKVMSPTEVPFSSSIKSGKSINQKKLEWGSEFLSPHQVTLGAQILIGDGTITLAAGEGAKVMVTDLIKIENEIVWVRAIATDTLTVTRGMGGTAAAAHTLNDTDGQPRILDLLSPAAQENADTPIAPIAKGTQEYNVPQLMDQGVQVSEREDNTPSYEFGQGSRHDAYLAKVMKEVAIDFEKISIHGRRGTESSAVVGSGTPTTLGGLDFFTFHERALAGAPLTEMVLMDMMQDSWERVGSENTPDTLLVGPFLRRALSSLWNSNRYSTVKDTTSTLVWNSVDTDFGPVKFTLSRYIPAGSAYLVDMSDISKHAYKGGEWREVALPANGPYKRSRFTGDYTIAFKGEQKRVKITGASTDAALYANM
jgi:hypothetical protein